ncbi:MAG: efflux RND transporter periplasmic adaptor subunit [Bacteroidales bacterium]
MKKNVVLICLIFGLLSCSSNDKTEHDPRLKVSAYEVKADSSTFSNEVSFISKPFRESDLSFRVSGPLQSFKAYSGDYFRKGEVIAEIDNRDFKVRRDKAKAAYLQAEAEYKRIQTLYNQDNVPQSALEKAEASFLVAKANYESAENELKDTRLLAPFDGYVQQVNVEVHQDVKAFQPIVSFIDMNKVKIEASVSQAVAASYKSGDLINVRFDGNTSESQRSAKILNISKSTSPNNLSFILTASVDNPDNTLLGGTSGVMFFPKAQDEAASTMLLIPLKAVCNTPTYKSYVWVLDQQSSKVHRRSVRTGKPVSNGMIQIIDGLGVDELVVLTGHSRMDEGDEVILKQ